MVEKIKIPAFIGGGVFVLFFIINAAVGNPFPVIFFRSLISGAVVSGIAFGFIFLMENYFDINFKDLGKDAVKDDSQDKEGIDIMLDDDEKTVKSGDENNLDQEGESQYDFNTSLGSGDEAAEDNADYESTGSVNADVSASNSSSNDSTDEDLAVDLNQSTGVGELNLDNFSANLGGSGDDYGMENSEPSEEAGGNENNYSSDYSNIKTGDGKTLKDKIGFEVSYDDAAKAIRTKFKEE